MTEQNKSAVKTDDENLRLADMDSIEMCITTAGYDFVCDGSEKIDGKGHNK